MKAVGLAALAGFSAPDTQIDRARGGRFLFNQGATALAFSVIHMERHVERIPNRAALSRLFLAPGIAHCAGGEALDQSDPLTAIVEWREHGHLPELLVAQGAASRTSPARFALLPPPNASDPAPTRPKPRATSAARHDP